MLLVFYKDNFKDVVRYTEKELDENNLTVLDVPIELFLNWFLETYTADNLEGLAQYMKEILPEDKLMKMLIYSTDVISPSKYMAYYHENICYEDLDDSFDLF